MPVQRQLKILLNGGIHKQCKIPYFAYGQILKYCKCRNPTLSFFSPLGFSIFFDFWEFLFFFFPELPCSSAPAASLDVSAALALLLRSLGINV